ncbi:hypothetical protein FBUS_02232 [Fasciolopsis buskii]|uniref:Uncharacterized protein n=1 Tax=Fasciolopsis buskii TaxID=27845 RepID=A0A8E0RQJ6_9TREM|nr:hypothetical protein FBUS_02232 [Fasciolopsis buski]
MDLQEEIEAGKRREDRMSEYNRRLTEHNANLQSEHLVTVQRLEEVTEKLAEQERLIAESKNESVAAVDQLLARVHQLETQSSDFQSQIERLRATECDLSEKLNREREQAQLTHRRDTARIRDLARQLSRVAQRQNSGPNEVTDTGVLTSLSRRERDSPGTDPDRKLCAGSRADSVHSIDLCSSVGTLTTGLAVNMTNKSVVLGNPLLASGNRTDHCLSIIGDQYTGRLTKDGAELDQAALLNKLDRLQRVQVQLTDEVEFLQERCYQLNEEINEKSRIIQHLLMMTDKQSGAVSPKSVETHRRQISHPGGLMASLYTSRSNSNVPNFDTCLETSHKLQQVLEETLFKNLILKVS